MITFLHTGDDWTPFKASGAQLDNGVVTPAANVSSDRLSSLLALYANIWELNVCFTRDDDNWIYHWMVDMIPESHRSSFICTLANLRYPSSEDLVCKAALGKASIGACLSRKSCCFIAVPTLHRYPVLLFLISVSVGQVQRTTTFQMIP